MGYFVGLGEDIHRLVPEKELLLGNVHIESPVGCLAVSDGDVLLHALCDSLLGAMGDNDIGFYFPPNDPKNEGIKSTEILRFVLLKLNEKGFEICNIDCVIIAEKPKLSPYQDRIKESLSSLLKKNGTPTISVKIKSNEGLDAIGRGEAIQAFVISSLNKEEK